MCMCMCKCVYICVFSDHCLLLLIYFIKIMFCLKLIAKIFRQLNLYFRLKFCMI